MILTWNVRFSKKDERIKNIFKLFFGDSFSYYESPLVTVSLSEDSDVLAKVIPKIMKIFNDNGIIVLYTYSKENKEFFYFNRAYNGFNDNDTKEVAGLTFMAASNINPTNDPKFIIDPYIAEVPNSITNEFTKCMIEVMSSYVNSNTSVLDVGCGKGLLSLAAHGFGSTKIDAIDINDHFLEMAEKTIYYYNQISKDTINIHKRDILKEQSEYKKYDIILCNLTSSMIMQLLKTDILYNSLSDKGYIIFGGFRIHSEEDIYNTLINNQHINNLTLHNILYYHINDNIEYIIIKKGDIK